MFSQEIYEQIEAYLEGSLNQVDVRKFEQQMADDPALAAEVTLWQQIDTAIGESDVADFQAMVYAEKGAFFEAIAEHETSMSSAPSQTSSKVSPQIGGWSRRVWAIAASVLILAFSALLILKMPSNKEANHEELYAQYFDTYDLSESLRSMDEDSSNADLTQALSQYKSGDFAAAAQSFQKLVANSPQDDALLFSLASTYLNQTPPRLAEAKQRFQKIVKANASFYVPQAQWYLALIALKKGKLEEAKGLLEKVIQSGDDSAKKSKELLETINQLSD